MPTDGCWRPTTPARSSGPSPCPCRTPRPGSGPSPPAGGPLETRPWRRSPGLPVLLYGLALPLAALGAILWRHRRSINEAHPSQCSRCGEPFHTTDSPDTTVCSKCHHLFVVKDGLHGESRKRKVDEAAAHQKDPAPAATGC